MMTPCNALTRFIYMLKEPDAELTQVFKRELEEENLSEIWRKAWQGQEKRDDLRNTVEVYWRRDRPLGSPCLGVMSYTWVGHHLVSTRRYMPDKVEVCTLVSKWQGRTHVDTREGYRDVEKGEDPGDVEAIITRWLKAYEYDGLVGDGCGCTLKDGLFECGELGRDCQPAYKHLCDPDGDDCLGCGADGDFCMRTYPPAKGGDE